MFIFEDWKDYELIDAGDGKKYERWGDIYLERPDPQVLWPYDAGVIDPHARYIRANDGGGRWEHLKPIPEKWRISWRDLVFIVHPMSFKHTGIFPEQAVNWAWMIEMIKKTSRPDMTVLNLFGYTGAATMACISAGAKVTHVDAAKGMIQQGKENLALSGLPQDRVRWINDDCVQFVRRELRRGSRYDAIILDPPSFGRGPNGETWKIEREIYALVDMCGELLSENPVFMLINSYTTGLQPLAMYNLLYKCVVKKQGGHIEAAEVGLRATRSGVILPCGASARWVLQ